MTLEIITEFRGEHSFLSNFDMNEFLWRGVMFKSGEHALHWAKVYHLTNGFDSASSMRERILNAATPSKAKFLGRMLPLDVPAWDARRTHYMREITHAKFGYVKDYAGKLLRTGCAPLVEGNTWGDTFWGKCRNDAGVVVGLNMLGTILMEERGYWLWYGQHQDAVVSSNKTLIERQADYG